MLQSQKLINKIKNLKDIIALRESKIRKLSDDIQNFRDLIRYCENDIKNLHFKNPQPGDFWHEMFNPVFIVLDVNVKEITICEDTINSNDGYSFNLHKVKKVTREQFDKELKCYSGPLSDQITYDVIPYRCLREVEIWKEKNNNLSSFSKN